jgi:hypothetical protein
MSLKFKQRGATPLLAIEKVAADAFLNAYRRHVWCLELMVVTELLGVQSGSAMRESVSVLSDSVLPSSVPPS